MRCPAGRYNKEPSGWSHCFSTKFRSMHLLAIRNLVRLKNSGGQIDICSHSKPGLNNDKSTHFVAIWLDNTFVGKAHLKEGIFSLLLFLRIFEHWKSIHPKHFWERWDFCIGTIPRKGLWVVWECLQIGARAIRWIHLSREDRGWHSSFWLIASRRHFVSPPRTSSFYKPYSLSPDNSRAALVTNKFLEAHCSPESVLPTSTWLTCSTDPNTARTWFLSLWNLTIAPHILDSVREGLQLYGRRARWVLSKKCQILPR